MNLYDKLKTKYKNILLEQKELYPISVGNIEKELIENELICKLSFICVLEMSQIIDFELTLWNVYELFSDSDI